MPKQIGNGKHKFIATGYCRRIQQTLSNSFLWSFVVKYFGEAVSRPGQLPPSVPLCYATESRLVMQRPAHATTNVGITV